MKLSEKIKFIRKNILNLSIEEFASILGVSRRTISSWENKQVLPAISNIISNSSFTFVQMLIKCIINSFYVCFMIGYPHNPLRP